MGSVGEWWRGTHPQQIHHQWKVHPLI